ncbi:phosphatidylinositol synthase [Elysia marginata]|uniref:Phosphatidylinositol synthase n=1 Tax=Elysia marginata TaxID=1093978 RepID=A0AAV4G8S4_9GAST|nr:phosphatidylinositol synthase [Elysia marginata]
MWEPRVRLLNKISTATVALLAAPGVTPGVDPPAPRLLYLRASVSRTCGRRRGLLSLVVSQAKSSSFGGARRRSRTENHEDRGENWKIPEENFPVLVKKVMENGFKTPAGFLAVGSLHVLPLWFYGYESRFFTQSLGLPMWLQLSGIVTLAVGRTVCAAVELFYCKEYVKDLLRQ